MAPEPAGAQGDRAALAYSELPVVLLDAGAAELDSGAGAPFDLPVEGLDGRTEFDVSAPSSRLPKFMSTSAAILAASPVTASMAVTSLETMLSAVMPWSAFWAVAAWLFFPHAGSARTPAMRTSGRINDSEA